MPSRRAVIATLGVAAAGGCLDRDAADRRSEPASATPTRADTASPSAPAATTSATESEPVDADFDDLPTWEPAWTHELGDRDALGIDAVDGTLYLTLGDDGGGSVAAFDPDGRAELWRTTLAAGPTTGGTTDSQPIARGKWGVTVTAETVYAVAGRVAGRQWSAVSALDRATGEVRWRHREERALSVVGVDDGLAVVTATQFSPPAGTPATTHAHDTPDEPPSTAVTGLGPDGAVRWRREFESVTDAALGPDGVSVVTPDGLVGLGRDGRRRFRYPAARGTLVVASDERVFYGTESTDGTGDAGTIHGVGPDGERGFRRSAPVGEFRLVDGTLYAADSGVAAVEPDGTVRWRARGFDQWLLPSPTGDRLYSRDGRGADRVTAYTADGERQWTLAPPTRNAWPEGATTEGVVTSAITAGETFLTTYLVRDGRPTAARGIDTVFDAAAVGSRAFLADGEGRLLAVDP